MEQFLNMWRSALKVPFTCLVMATILAPCGFLSPGRSGIQDPVPQGVIVAQGTFLGLNGNTASGAAVIYLTPSSQYIARLEAFQGPSQNAMLIEVVADGSVVFSSSLTGISGNQNYNVGAITVSNWNYINILSSSTPPPNNILARANLIRVTTNP
jgi:hypothetical protein